MKAEIFQTIGEANQFMQRADIIVDHVDIQTFEKKTSGAVWTEERIIIYYTEEKK